VSVPLATSSRRWLALTIVLAAAWSLVLLGMDATTARPQIVSRDQILTADAVVVARRDSAEGDRVRVERVFRGSVAEGDSLRIVNFPEVQGSSNNQDWVLALSREGGDFVITTLDGQRAPPRVYASSPATVEQVKSILRDKL
jgi:hypothetical protein